MSIHIEAKKEDISKKVLVCGDPLRCKFIAEKYLKDYKCINKIRNMLGYTGYYKNELITVMSHGMGNPSMGIYSYELFNDYDVDVIIRIGTAGSYSEDIKVNDIVLATESYSDSIYNYNSDGDKSNINKSSESVDNIIINESKKHNIDLKSIKVYSSDVFYTKEDISNTMKEQYNCDAVEMETFALFKNANIFNKKASCLLTISDSFVSNDILTKEQREKGLSKMIELALDSINSL